MSAWLDPRVFLLLLLPSHVSLSSFGLEPRLDPPSLLSLSPFFRAGWFSSF